MNFNEIEITVYNGVRDTKGHRATLNDFLTKVDYKTIDELRSCNDDERRRLIKQSLPQATISGVFAPSRSAENLVEHSGLICVDVDRKDNTHIDNFDTLITDVFSQMDEVAFAAHSVSGNGYFLIIPLKYPERHTEQFKKLVQVFAKYKINIDQACSDVCRLRCQSYDLYQYINLDAKPFPGIYREPRKPIVFHPADNDTEEKVARLCRQIEQNHIDLTSNYDDWVKIGAALSTIGENGRQWYHLCSAQNANYNASECDRKFTNLIRTTRKITIATFFHYCKQAGLELKKEV